jgi:hypothetical protein
MITDLNAAPAWSIWHHAVGDLFEFSADRYSRNGSLNEAGGAHFFYGNTIDLDAGVYGVTVVVEKPFGIGLPDVQLEALDWSAAESSVGAVSKFFVGADSHAFVATLILRIGKRTPVELRGWSGSSATLLDFRQITVQRLDAALLEAAAQAALAASPNAPFLLDRQLYWAGGAGGEPWFINPIGSQGASIGRWELVQGTGHALCGKAGQEMWSFALPNWLFEQTAGLVMSAGADLFLLADARGNAASSPPAKAPDVPDLTAPVARLLRFREEAEARLDRIDTQVDGAIAELRATLTEAMAEIGGWRHQIPNLLNAISSAQAAAGIVARAGLWEQDDRPTRAEILQIQTELNALRQALHKG